jgi:N-acetylneuraminic acid mutarotase
MILNFIINNQTKRTCLDNRQWNVVSTSGALVQGSYGHSSVWDPLTKRIYVYGGYQSESSSTYGLTDAMYSFDPAQRIWRMHPSSGSYRYLHSAIMSGGLMLIYGGNTHNETAISNVTRLLL